MELTDKSKQEILSAVNDMHEAYRRRDLNALLSSLHPDANTLLFGTGPGERRVGHQEIRFQAERDWAQTESGEFTLDWHTIDSFGDIAWIAGEGVAHISAGGSQMSAPYRMTAVLRKQDGKWLFTQAHYSMPAANPA